MAEMTSSNIGGRPKRRTFVLIGALAAAAVGALAVVATAFAHHVTYMAIATCETWTATSTYVAGPNPTLRLVVLENVVVNGVPYDPSWSSGFTAPGFASGSTTPVTDAVPAPAGRYFQWQGVVESAVIFNRHQGNSGEFNTADAAWTGRITIYKRNETNDGWVLQEGVNANVYRPEAATDCESTILRAEPTPTATPTKTVVSANVPGAPSAGTGRAADGSGDNFLWILIGTLIAGSVTLAVVATRRDA